MKMILDKYGKCPSISEPTDWTEAATVHVLR
jgi:hypothetical protein